MGGRLISDMVLSHYGWLGSPKHPATPANLIGGVVLIVGIVLTTRR